MFCTIHNLVQASEVNKTRQTLVLVKKTYHIIYANNMLSYCTKMGDLGNGNEVIWKLIRGIFNRAKQSINTETLNTRKHT